MSKDTCVLCPFQAGESSPLCPACSALNSKGWPIVHGQEIHAGDYFEGLIGFVWDGEASRPGFIRLYSISDRVNDQSRIFEYHELRVRAGKRVSHNPNGHMVRGVWEPGRDTR